MAGTHATDRRAIRVAITDAGTQVSSTVGQLTLAVRNLAKWHR